MLVNQISGKTSRSRSYLSQRAALCVKCCADEGRIRAVSTVCGLQDGLMPAEYVRKFQLPHLFIIRWRVAERISRSCIYLSWSETLIQVLGRVEKVGMVSRDVSEHTD